MAGGEGSDFVEEEKLGVVSLGKRSRSLDVVEGEKAGNPRFVGPRLHYSIVFIVEDATIAHKRPATRNRAKSTPGIYSIL